MKRRLFGRTGLRSLLLAPLLLGCGAGERRAPAYEDSAAVASNLELRVPGEVVRAAFLDSTRLLVQAGRSSLFVYDRAEGRRTLLVDGPIAGGRQPDLLWSQVLPDGTVAAYDARSREVRIYDSTGAVVRATSLEAPTGFPVPVAAFRDGAMLVLRDHLPSPYVQEDGMYGDTTALMPIAASMEPLGADIPVTRARRFAERDALSASDAPHVARQVRAVAGGVFDGRARRSIEVPLSPRTVVAATSDGFYIGRSDSAEVRLLDPTGRELRRIRIAEAPQPLDAATVERLRTALQERGGDEFAELYRQVELPSQTPRFGQLLADRAGRLWVEQYRLDADGPQRWTVYARDGERAGSIVLPRGSRLLDASARELLLARSGRLGAEVVHVTSYRLR